VIEDEVCSRLNGYGGRRRVGETKGLFIDRQIAFEVVELTSRESTSNVAKAKARLAQPSSGKDHVDVAIATSMISVGLDITRLGLMVVMGQPKASAEYIQATSRVGRDETKPGLVVTLLNVHKPRDRSYYERFCSYHQTFYRSVEATSVTPFSPRALDRGLAGTLVALARLGNAQMTPPLGAGEILRRRSDLNVVANGLAERAAECGGLAGAERDALRERVRERAARLLDVWERITNDYLHDRVQLKYQSGEQAAAKPLLHEFLHPELMSLPDRFGRFRANRSLRDVEPSVDLWLRKTDGTDLEEDD
jgi:hypothetical protein